GRVSAGESCDDGAGNGNDGCCSASCALLDGDGDGICDALDLCTAPAVRGGNIAASGLLQVGTDHLLVSSRLALGSPIDPATNGVRVLLTDVGAHSLVDATIPGGAGWTTSPSGKSWKYTAPTGIVSVKIQKLQSDAKVKVIGVGQLFAATHADVPLAATLL